YFRSSAVQAQPGSQIVRSRNMVWATIASPKTPSTALSPFTLTSLGHGRRAPSNRRALQGSVAPSPDPEASEQGQCPPAETHWRRDRPPRAWFYRELRTVIEEAGGIS